MKKITLSFCALFMAATFAFAQGGAAKKMEQIKQGLKTEVKLTDAQIASVMAVEAEFKPQVKVLKDDKAMDESTKKEKMVAIRAEKSKKLEAVLGKDLAKRVDEFYVSQKKDKPESESKKKK